MAEETETDEAEPSIEEILASIRQIISDDDEEGEAPAEEAEAPAEEEPEPPAEDTEEDVIELTDRVEEEGEPPAEEPEEEVPAEPEEVPAEESVEIDLMAADEIEEAPTPEPEPTPEPPAPPPASEEDPFDSILTENAEAAALDAFSEITRKTAVEMNGITLEEIVRAELRPLLRAWLDDNLPSMIERLVQEELERVAKRAQGEDF